jgi:addiction module RelE/StbE family toxin
MQVRWTAPASQDLQRITRRIRRDNPTAARQVAKTLYDGALSLGDMPNRGRIGRIAGTREFVSAPFIIVYRIEAEILEILRIYHSAQDWP